MTNYRALYEDDEIVVVMRSTTNQLFICQKDMNEEIELSPECFWRMIETMHSCPDIFLLVK